MSLCPPATAHAPSQKNPSRGRLLFCTVYCHSMIFGISRALVMLAMGEKNRIHHSGKMLSWESQGLLFTEATIAVSLALDDLR